MVTPPMVRSWQDNQPSPHLETTGANATSVRWGFMVHDEQGKEIGSLVVTSYRLEEPGELTRWTGLIFLEDE